MKREIFITVGPEEVRAAVTEDGTVHEVYVERTSRKSIVGNIYLGRVDAVVPGIEAVFVDIGHEKNAYLSLADVESVDEEPAEETRKKGKKKAAEPTPEAKDGGGRDRRRSGRRNKPEFKAGQKIMVQVMKDPKGSKGPRVTTQLSLAGRYMVYMPDSKKLGVSKKLSDAQRDRLRELVKKKGPRRGGMIIRTAAADAELEDILGDLKYLNGLWQTVQKKAASAKPPKMIFADADLVLRTARDTFTQDFSAIHIDSKADYKKLVSFFKSTEPKLAERIKLYQDKKPLFEQHDIQRWIRKALSRYVQLKSGGYMVVDKAEALTAIDINTGKFVGRKSLEETVTKTNVEAAKAVVHQIRLRDIGGLIVIDFIDMSNEKNRRLVMETLNKELERDRSRTRVAEISPMGLVEMTRKSLGGGVASIMLKECPTCGGRGAILSEETCLIEMWPGLVRALKRKRKRMVKLALHPFMLDYLSVETDRLREIEEESGKKVLLSANEQLEPGEYKILD